MNPESTPETHSIDVISWNILMDKTRTKAGTVVPQSIRLPSLIQSLETLKENGLSLDVVGICEAHAVSQAEVDARGSQEPVAQHNGDLLAKGLGFEESFWANHNTSKRKGEHIGMFGNLVHEVEEFALPADKKAMIANIGDIAVSMNHFRMERWGKQRQMQAEALLERMSDAKYGFMGGDWNLLPIEKARRFMRKAGYVPVYDLFSSQQIGTFPTDEYRPTFQDELNARHVKGPILLDGMYVKGLEVEDAGVFVGASDHVGLYARVRKPDVPLLEPTRLYRAKGYVNDAKISLKPFLMAVA